MSIGNSFYDQKGTVYLTEPMVAYTYKGRLILRRQPKSRAVQNTQRTVNRRMQLGFLGRLWITLSEKERCAWETYAEMVYNVGDRNRQDTTGRCGGIIPRRRMPSTGRGAFIQGNLLLHSLGLQKEGILEQVCRKAPLNTGFPPAPTNVSLGYENGIAEVRWTDPITAVEDGVEPSIKKIRIWVRFISNVKAQSQIAGIVDVPSEGRFTFDSVRVNVGGKMLDMKLSDMRSGMLYVQLDTVIAVAEGVGAVRSVGSNIDRKAVIGQMA